MPIDKWPHETDRWKDMMVAKVMREERIDHIFWRKRHAKWLKQMLTSHDVPYRCHYIGQAVILTTNVTQCPCCFAIKGKGWNPHAAD